MFPAWCPRKRTCLAQVPVNGVFNETWNHFVFVVWIVFTSLWVFLMNAGPFSRVCFSWPTLSLIYFWYFICLCVCVCVCVVSNFTYSYYFSVCECVSWDFLYIHIYIYIYIYTKKSQETYIYIYICVCVCVCVCLFPSVCVQDLCPIQLWSKFIYKILFPYLK